MLEKVRTRGDLDKCCPRSHLPLMEAVGLEGRFETYRRGYSNGSSGLQIAIMLLDHEKEDYLNGYYAGLTAKRKAMRVFCSLINYFPAPYEWDKP